LRVTAVVGKVGTQPYNPVISRYLLSLSSIFLGVIPKRRNIAAALRTEFPVPLDLLTVFTIFTMIQP
jgi:hypothetical protein